MGNQCPLYVEDVCYLTTFANTTNIAEITTTIKTKVQMPLAPIKSMPPSKYYVNFHLLPRLG